MFWTNFTLASTSIFNYVTNKYSKSISPYTYLLTFYSYCKFTFVEFKSLYLERKSHRIRPRVRTETPALSLTQQNKNPKPINLPALPSSALETSRESSSCLRYSSYDARVLKEIYQSKSPYIYLPTNLPTPEIFLSSEEGEEKERETRKRRNHWNFRPRGARGRQRLLRLRVPCWPFFPSPFPRAWTKCGFAHGEYILARTPLTRRNVARAEFYGGSLARRDDMCRAEGGSPPKQGITLRRGREELIMRAMRNVGGSRGFISGTK